MSGSLIDSNVLLDIATADPSWMAWSQQQLRDAAARGAVYVNPIISAELAAGFTTKDELDRWLDPGLFQRAPLPYDAGWLAAQAFIQYRRGGGTRTSPLPDFYIGAHAEVEQLTLVSRDAARYRTYFPSVVLISP
jgi:predicted nucleic acid-binding protein